MIVLRAPWPRRWLKIGFWIVLLGATYFAFAPPGAQPDLPMGSVARHSFAFIVLTIALNASHFPRGPLWAPAALLAGYGMAIEAIQAFIPYRSAEWFDLLVDAVGIAIGSMIYLWLGRGVVERWFR
jgi:hypothetical protein